MRGLAVRSAVLVLFLAAVTPACATGVPPSQPAEPLALDDCMRVVWAAYPPEGAPCLMVVSDGAADALILEWVGGPVDATGWQYRQGAADGEWTVPGGGEEWATPDELPWTDVPDSGSSTWTYRITGLRADTDYYFWLRPVVNGRPGPASNAAPGATQYPDGRRPDIRPDQIVEGDGATEWRIPGCRCVFTIPAGMRLLGHREWRAIGGGSGVSFTDVASGSAITFDRHGKELGRTNGELGLQQDAGVRFDKLTASVRMSPAIPPPLQRRLRPTPPLTLPTCRGVAAAVGNGGPPEDGPCLMVVSEGATDSLLLEWAGGPADATGWQYRARRWKDHWPLEWGDWHDLPYSSTATRRARITGLRTDMDDGIGYDFQVRAVVGDSPGLSSNVGQGHSQPQSGLPDLGLHQVGEGDGETLWGVYHTGWVFVIPDGMRLLASLGRTAALADERLVGRNGWRVASPPSGVSVSDMESHSWIVFNSYGLEQVRMVYKQRVDVGALFDELAASVHVWVPTQGTGMLVSEPTGQWSWVATCNGTYEEGSGSALAALDVAAVLQAFLDSCGYYVRLHAR